MQKMKNANEEELINMRSVYDENVKEEFNNDIKIIMPPNKKDYYSGFFVSKDDYLQPNKIMIEIMKKNICENTNVKIRWAS